MSEPEAATAVAATNFIPHKLAPEEQHRAALLEAIEQMLEANASALYFDPGHEHLRIGMAAPTGAVELASVPLSVGRLIVEALRQEAVLKSDPAETIHGPFSYGVLRVEHGGVERRLSVELTPTVFGPAAVLRVMATLPASADLAALGLSAAQAPVVEALLSSGSGLLVVLGGPDRDWVMNTCAALLARAAALGRRAAVVGGRPGPDIAGVARIEAGHSAADGANAIARVAQADYTCIGVEQFLAPEVARAAAQAALDCKALLLCVAGGRSAPEAINFAFNAGLSGNLAATIALATCQIQLPLLCTQCAKWGDVSAEDIAYFGLDPTRKTNLYIRTGCPACNGQVTQFGQIFEVCAITEELRERIRAGAPYARLEGELITAPGYVRLLHRVGEAIQEGRCSPPEARHYYNWQIPAGVSRAPNSGLQKAV